MVLFRSSVIVEKYAVQGGFNIKCKTTLFCKEQKYWGGGMPCSIGGQRSVNEPLVVGGGGEGEAS